jgi:hypothetical protein
MKSKSLFLIRRNGRAAVAAGGFAGFLKTSRVARVVDYIGETEEAGRNSF